MYGVRGVVLSLLFVDVRCASQLVLDLPIWICAAVLKDPLLGQEAADHWLRVLAVRDSASGQDSADHEL